MALPSVVFDLRTGTLQTGAGGRRKAVSAAYLRPGGHARLGSRAGWSGATGRLHLFAGRPIIAAALVP